MLLLNYLSRASCSGGSRSAVTFLPVPGFTIVIMFSGSVLLACFLRYVIFTLHMSNFCNCFIFSETFSNFSSSAFPHFLPPVPPLFPFSFIYLVIFLHFSSPSLSSPLSPHFPPLFPPFLNLFITYSFLSYPLFYTSNLSSLFFLAPQPISVSNR